MASNKSRDEFTAVTRRAIERQARSHCSNPMCRRLTSAAASDGVGEINIGEAAHICAAAPGGPRYDPNMTSEVRRSAENGIWLCRLHARAIDSNDPKFTVALLREWKHLTDLDSWRSVMNDIPFAPNMYDPEADGQRDRLQAAAGADLAVFRHTAKWPATAVSLTLTVERLEAPLTTRALAKAVLSLDDLILIAAPGMGKTTTIFQIAEAIMDLGTATAIIVPLGDWATEADPLLASILKRPAFAGVSESEFRTVAAKPGVVILLDGWNEMDAAARQRAWVQTARLKAELPELGLVISTRRQALDVPFAGTRVSLLPLGDEQQLEVARGMRGEEGERLVDQAWRTEGVRELVTIPLYLTTLLSLPKDSPFPNTKEEVLRRFVDAQEREAGHRAALEAVADGFQKDYLDGLAVFATTTANTSISDYHARGVVNETAKRLLGDGQISFITAQPQTVLNTLVSNHVLTRSGDAPGYSFQHQQFQEWYASHEVERRMLQAVGDLVTRKRLKADVFDQRSWTEAILFAVERAARGDLEHVTACGTAILAAFDVDPILAGEMIFRATDDVWNLVVADVQLFVRRWHAVGKVDRAVRFMITSGRHEFLDLLWPLLTHESEQVHLTALRAAGRFRPSVFGPRAADLLIGLAPAIRRNVLHEIASRSGMDGLDLATAIAKRNSDREEKALVVDALSFRRADRHIIDLLRDADDATFDLLIGKGHLDDVADEGVRRALGAAQARRIVSAATPRERLTAIVQLGDEQDLSGEVSDLVAALTIDQKDDSWRYLFHKLHTRYPLEFAEGLLRRIRQGQDLFFGADNLLAASGIVVEDGVLLKIVLQDSERRNDRAEAAASVLGPQSVAKLIAAYLDALPGRRGADGKFDQAVCDRCSLLRDRIAHTPGSSLVAAVRSRAEAATNAEIASLAELCTRGENGDDERARPFNEADLAAVRHLADSWGERLLASATATRLQKVTIATLISRVPSTSLLPILERLLDDNLGRYRDFRAAAKASGWRDQDAVTEAQHPQMHGYQWAFAAIRAPETDHLMVRYLTDEHFGEIAARILAGHWTDANEPKGDRKFGGGIDFSVIAARRAVRAVDPAASSAAADAIFDAIDQLLAEGTNDEQKLRAVTLGIVGARLPHGLRAGTINRLLALAHREARASFLLSLLLSGEDVDIGLVADGIAETFEAAKKQTWILHQGDAYQLRDWFRLLPFATPLSQITPIVRAIPDAQRTPHFLEEMMRGLGNAPAADEAEKALFALAENDERFYRDYHWRQTAFGLGTVSSALRLVNLTVNGALNGKGHDGWRAQHDIASLIAEHGEVRTHVRDLLRNGPLNASLELLSHALSEQPEPEDIVLLVEMEFKTGRPFVGWHSLERLATRHVPSEHWLNAYNVVPVPAVALRQNLLGLTTDGGPADPASRALVAIDKLRDEYGAPEAEPRHPDLASGRIWPILTPDPDADDSQ